MLISIGAAFVLKLSSVICHRNAALPFNNQALFANNPALLRNTRALLKVHKKSRIFCALFLEKSAKKFGYMKIILYLCSIIKGDDRSACSDPCSPLI